MTGPTSQFSDPQPRDGAAVSLPVLGEHPKRGQVIRPSRNARKRAIVLATVQILIIAHIVQWLVMGTTTTPVEPSEAMEFSKYGVINAGLIFFVLALLSTLILGRWFCGWGCHVVLLQDLCGWMMKKLGVRPKPFRSRLLMWVPLLLGIYMFIWPAFYRFVILPFRDVPDVQPWALQAHLITTDFWATFPGLMVAIPFLLICGFATVYFLGSKGFCTYGCPYGGFFAAVDEYSPARIRVTDACEQCGHCTAVCTSNVRVHEEVREYGMVVDPGCMKCLDCVSVCPNDALYFGFGKTAANKGQPKHREPKRKFDFSLREEVAFGLVFAAIFFSFRGDYISFPLLMAAGVAIVMLWIVWKAWRLTREANANLHRFQLKLRGTFKPVGTVLMGVATVIMLFVVHSGAVNAMNAVGSWFDGKVTVSSREVLSGQIDRSDASQLDHAGQAIAWYERALTTAGGQRTLSIQWRHGIHMRMAWLHLVRGEHDLAETRLRAVVDDASGDTRHALARSLGLVLATQPERVDDALAWYRHVLVEQPVEHAGLIVDDFMTLAAQHSHIAEAAHDILRERLELVDEETAVMRWLALLLLDRGELAEGIALLERVVEIDPDDRAGRELLEAARRSR